jgi:2,5-diketo-D-gluconate reductase A
MSTNPGTSGGPTVEFSDGNRIPVLGLGVWQVANGPECVRVVRDALEVGYRHIDTAQAYSNEESVGEGLRVSSLGRDDVFITTKFFPASRDPAVEIEHSLERLGVEYVDLYVIHWPQRGATWAWPGMERAHDRGHARSIGVSNFDLRELDELLAITTVAPVINQVQFSPFEYRRKLFDGATARGLLTEAYSPLGTGHHLSDTTVERIASDVGRTPAQVLLRWCVQREVVVLTKSTHRERMTENAAIFDFTLSPSDMDALDRLDRTDGTDHARDDKWW